MLYFKLFDEAFVRSAPKAGVKTPTVHKQLQRIFRHNHSTIEAYYLSRKFSVKHTHIVARMVESMPARLDLDLTDYSSVAEDRLEDLSRAYGFTSGYSKGIVHPPYFYGNEGSCIILDQYKPINLELFDLDWRTYPCIETITHNRNDTKLLLPTGADDGARPGISVIGINVLALAAKYREFLRTEAIRFEEGHSPMTKGVFVTRYVLPNMMSSDIDHLVLNRVIDRFYGNKTMTPKYKHKFTLLSMEDKLDKYADSVVKTITETDLDFVGILKNIPLIFAKDASDLLAFKDIPDVRQTQWAMLASRMRYMIFCYDVAKKKGMSADFVEEWKLMVSRFKSSNALNGTFGSGDMSVINSQLNYIANMDT